MPEAPAATPVLSTTTTSSPALARCQAVDRPWTPAPITRCLTEGGREGGTGDSFAGTDVAYEAMALPHAALASAQPRPSQCERASLPPAIPAPPLRAAAHRPAVASETVASPPPATA